MASELVRVVWCDIHGKAAGKAAPHSDVIAVSSVRKQLDTCNDCYTMHVEPLLKLLMELGHTVTEFEEPEPGRTKTPVQFFCNACERPRGFVRKANYDKHMESEHGLRNARQAAPEPQDDGTIVCTVCPEREPFHSKAGFSGHLRSKEHKENLALTA